MTPSEVLMAIQLFVTIEPVAVAGINSVIALFESSNLSADEKMKMLVDISTAMKPMQIKE